MARRIDSVPPIIQNIIEKLWDRSQEEWARENAALSLENIASVCGSEARNYRKKQAQRKIDAR